MTETFKIPLEVAEVYEQKFVPSIFAEWAPHGLDAARVDAGGRLLDAACGTGIVARTAADRVGPNGTIVGLDLNEAMLTVARRVRPDLTWRQGDVQEIPFDDDSFDSAVCQMALMFLPDRARALAEMGRVVVPAGRVVVVVPASLDAQPAYRPFVDIAVRHAGAEAAALLDTYFNCGDLGTLVATAASAGLEVVDQRTRTGTARFDSAADFVATEVEGSPLIDRLDDATYAAISHDVATELDHYVTPAGTFEIPLLGHVVAAEPT